MVKIVVKCLHRTPQPYRARGCPLSPLRFATHRPTRRQSSSSFAAHETYIYYPVRTAYEARGSKNKAADQPLTSSPLPPLSEHSLPRLPRQRVHRSLRRECTVQVLHVSNINNNTASTHRTHCRPPTHPSPLLPQDPCWRKTRTSWQHHLRRFHSTPLWWTPSNLPGHSWPSPAELTCMF
jgi:hypothetical protein